VFSGGIGSYLYGQSGGVDLGIVVPLLFGSALGARIGSAATAVVDADDIKVYFGGMLLAGSVAVGIGEIGTYLGNETWRRWDSFSLSALRSSWPRRSSSPRFGRSGRLVITCPLRPTNSRSPAAGQLRRRATAPTDRTR